MRKVFIGWGFHPDATKVDDEIVNCGEWPTAQDAIDAVSRRGLVLAEVEVEWRNNAN